MALFENFPYTNLQDLNLSWILEQLKKVEHGGVISVNGQTGEVILFEDPDAILPAIDTNTWSIVRNANGNIAGIHFNNDGKAFIVSGQTLDEIYSKNNPPDFPVKSVNGMTGDVQLFEGQYIRLPDLTEIQMQNWTLYRLLNGVALGIQFNQDGSVSFINGVNRSTPYTDNNPPPYPVTSVDGATGAVILYPDTDIQFNDITDPAEHSVRFFSMLNLKMLGVEIAEDGRAYVWKDEDRYPLYIQGVNDPASTWVNPTAGILEIADNLSTGESWAIVREVANADKIGIDFSYDPSEQKYFAYLRVNNTLSRLMTLDEIPSGSGVISINGETGVVTLTGHKINVSSSIPKPIDEMLAEILLSICIMINGDEASQNIKAGDYCFILNSSIVGILDGFYKAVNNVSAGTPFVAADLEQVAIGGLNDIVANIEVPTLDFEDLTADFAFNSAYVNLSDSSMYVYRYGKIVFFALTIYLNNTGSGWINLIYTTKHTYAGRFTGVAVSGSGDRALRTTIHSNMIQTINMATGSAYVGTLVAVLD